jgi:hypothetical protein
VPHISLVFREMWDTTNLNLNCSLGAENWRVERSGLPHLAKNERDMGHPRPLAGKGLSELLLALEVFRLLVQRLSDGGINFIRSRNNARFCVVVRLALSHFECLNAGIAG